MADLLKVIAESQNARVNKRYYDILYAEPVKEDTRSADEIAFDIITRAGLKFRED
jgi:hypothetical protein